MYQSVLREICRVIVDGACEPVGDFNRRCLQVIPMLSGDATDQTPPDLPSFLFKERIVYLVRALNKQSDTFAPCRVTGMAGSRNCGYKARHK
jgi:hypothetical protein